MDFCAGLALVDERLVGLRWNGKGDCVIAGRYLARSVDGSAEGCR